MLLDYKNHPDKVKRKEKKRIWYWKCTFDLQDSVTSFQRTSWMHTKGSRFARCTCYLELLCWRWALIWCKRRSSTTWRTSRRGSGSSKRVTTRKMPTTTTRTTSNTTTRLTTSSRATFSILLDATRWLGTFAEFPSPSQPPTPESSFIHQIYSPSLLQFFPSFFIFSLSSSFFLFPFPFLFQFFFFSSSLVIGRCPNETERSECLTIVHSQSKIWSSFIFGTKHASEGHCNRKFYF